MFPSYRRIVSLTSISQMFLGGEDAGGGRRHLRYAVAAVPRDARLQQFRHHVLQSQFHGPLVPHVRKNLRLHQQVDPSGAFPASIKKRSSAGALNLVHYANTTLFPRSAINPILYTAMSIKFRRAFQRILLCRIYGKLFAAREIFSFNWHWRHLNRLFFFAPAVGSD